MKKITAIVMALTMALLICASGCDSVGSPLNPKNPVTVNMWHNYGGDMQQAMDTLIDEFNSTVGKEKGIVINVTAISSSAELNESLAMIVNGDPGAPEMPDIFTGYPQIASQFHEKDMIVNFADYFSSEELDTYVDEFVNEGKIGDGLYVFPIAKSTEILYLNKTLFDAFSAETGADFEKLATFEGIAELSKEYYEWTDAKTPDVQGDGKQFFTADSWFNVAQVGIAQLGGSIFDETERFSLGGEAYEHIFETIFTPAVEGGIALYDGYSSDLSKTGDLVCSTGSSAGILFYGDTITYKDGTVENVDYSILPYPIFEGGAKIALQRGGGMMVAKSEEKKEYAACEFIKWFTASEQNMKFVSHTGYLPVTKKAFEDDMQDYLGRLEEERIKKMLTAVLLMYDSYEFFTAPNYSDFNNTSKNYEKEFKQIITQQRNEYLGGGQIDLLSSLDELRK